MPSDTATSVAEGFRTLQSLVSKSEAENDRVKKASKRGDAVTGLFSSLKNSNPGDDPVEKGRNEMLQIRQNKADSGFSQDRNLPAPRK
jgi:hypothetical protein